MRNQKINNIYLQSLQESNHSTPSLQFNQT